MLARRDVVQHVKQDVPPLVRELVKDSALEVVGGPVMGIVLLAAVSLVVTPVRTSVALLTEDTLDFLVVPVIAP